MQISFKYYFLLLSFLVSFHCAIAQDVVLHDFESESPAVGALHGAAYSASENPLSEGINSTANCAQISRTSTNWYEMVYFPVDFTLTQGETKYLHMMVKYDAQPDIIIRTDAETTGARGSVDMRAINSYTDLGIWQDIVFELNGAQSVIQINLLADAGWENSPSGQILNNTSSFGYIDEIILSDSSTPRTASSNGVDKNVVFDMANIYQTIQGFGASDAWNTDPVGDYWNILVKNDIAKKLFSKSVDASGNPLGIGLSRWRFNIGGGSAEQGDNANIEMPERRAECFLNEDGSYNWTKQSGQQWFLNQANDYGVEQLVAFVNSPPRFYTKNGRANSDNSDRYGGTNLADDHYGDFATFMADVIKHFEDEGIHFSQISPINEPQYEWSSGQEGCPWLNYEVTQLVGELNTALLNNDLSTNILLSEAADYRYMYSDNGNGDKGDLYWKFFSNARSEYLGDNSLVLQGLGGHSYWTETDDATIRSVRQNVYNKSIEFGKEFYQTEYCMMNDYHGSDKLANSLFLGKLIYADLAIANACTWDYWTAIERERWSQYNRFYLIRLQPNGGDYADLSAGGSISADKNLWVLGNYSFFIRPGYKRIGVSGANNLADLMGSAYLAPDNSEMVAVYVNWSESAYTVYQTFQNIPDGYEIAEMTPYITDETHNLQKQSSVQADEVLSIAPRSVTTFVIKLQNKNTTAVQTISNSAVQVYGKDKMICVQGAISKLEVFNLQGRLIQTQQPNSDYNELSVHNSAIYIVKTIHHDGSVQTNKVLVK